ncbi:MAG: hypothetical protein KAI50_08285, partial [Desulfobacterales bacterium]|nr:hypothetical protein [Desulfobacterales bacterium]
KSALLESALPTPCSKKDISFYTAYANTPGLSNHRIRLWFATLTQSILIRYNHQEVIIIVPS